MTPAIGLIGAGAMGLAVASNLRRRGWPVAVRDIAPEREALARALGADVRPTPAALADCDVVIVLVVNSAQVDDVVFGPGGLVPGWRAGAILLLCSTVAPEHIEVLEGRLAAEGLHLVAAPISGGPARAEDGTISAMVAGDAIAVSRCAPVLDQMAARRFDFGARPADAARAKLVNNLLAAINLAGAAEGLALAERLGLDSARVLDLVMASSGASWVGGDRMTRALSGDYEPRAALPILAKDVRLALDMAHHAGFPPIVGAAARSIFEAALAQGMGHADDAVLLEYYRRLTVSALY